jgi:hypothetical protein
MAVSSKNTDEYLELRKAKLIYILIAFVFFVVVLINLIDKQRRNGVISIFYPNFSWYSLAILLLLLTLIFILIFNLSDNRIKLKISDEGIWTKKYNTIFWKDIWYVSTDEPAGLYGKAISLTIKLKQNGEGEEGHKFNVGLATLNYDIDKFWKVMNFYCAKYHVESLGHTLTKGSF